MTGAIDKAKGRVKEAVGALTGDAKLKRQGKIDRVAGNVKNAIGRAKKAADKAVDRVRDRGGS